MEARCDGVRILTTRAPIRARASRDVMRAAAAAAVDDDAHHASIAMLDAVRADDARALRREFQRLCAAFYASHARTMTVEERADALDGPNGANDGGVRLVDVARARGGRGGGCYAWLVGQGARETASVDVDDDDADGGASSSYDSDYVHEFYAKEIGGERYCRSSTDADDDDDDERDWFAKKLKDEYAADARAADGAPSDDWVSYADVDAPSASVLGDEYHRAEVWAAAERARRGVKRMHRRDVEDEKTRERRAREAKAQQRKLEELEAKDRAWRESLATKARTMTTMSADEYRAKWRALEEGKAKTLALRDFPFIDAATMKSASALCEFLTVDIDADKKRITLREEMMRWHPDKFAKYFAVAREEDLEQVKERVNVTAQAVREAFKAFQQPL